MIPETNPIAEAALQYARRGWAIVPLNGKRPIPKEWQLKATTDERQILAWLKRYPEANIGLATGAKSGFFVLDVDGPEGEQSLRQLELQHGPLPETLEGETGGGGRHILLRMPDGVDLGNANRNLKHSGFTKLDIRGTGGQIVAPPSVHPDTGVLYRWATHPDETAIADAPAWLVELLTREDEEAEDRPRVAEVIQIHDERARKYGLAALDSEGRELAETQEGGRNDRLNKAAMKMGGLSAACGITEAMAEAVLIDAALRTGLAKKEAIATFRSGWKAGVKKPRPIPEPKASKPAPARAPKASAVPVPPADDFEDLIDDYESRAKDLEEEEDLEEEPGHGNGSGGGPGPLPTITIEGGELDLIVDQAEAALVHSPVQVYRLGGALVRPIRETSMTPKSGVMRKAESLLLKPVEEAWLVEAFTKVAFWQKWDGRKNDYRRIDCPALIARTYMARQGQWRVPPIRGIIEAPTLRPDGSILEAPGYDGATGLLFEPGRTKFAPIPENPTREDAIAALEQIKDVLKGFPFDESHDLSIAIAAILSALVRRSVPTAPLFAFNAPKMGSGKSLLADCVSLFATGREASVMTPQKNPEEEAKALFAVLLQGDPVVVIDNVSAPLGSDLLCTLMTSQTYQGRVLGSTKTISVPTCATWMATGNQLQFVGDLTTRVLMCDLDPQMERPEERSFDINLKDFIPENRGTLVPAALTVLRAYVVAGWPKQDVPQLGRFEVWSNWIRGALIWAGMADPCLSRHDLEASDPVRTQLIAVLSAWYDAFASERRTVQQAIGLAKAPGYEQLLNALMEVAASGSDVNPRRLGKWLKRFEKRIEGGFRLEQDGIRDGITVWKVSKVSSGFSALSGFPSNPHGKIADTETAKSHEQRGSNALNPSNPLGPIFDQPDTEEGEA